MNQRTGTAAILALACAIGGYISTCGGHPFRAIFLELLAILCGGIGLMMAASPRVSGGIMSISAIALAVIGLVFAVLGCFGVLLLRPF